MRDRRWVALCGFGLVVTMGLHPAARMTAAAANGQTMLEATKEAEQRAAVLDRKLEELVSELRTTTARNSWPELRDLQARWQRLTRAECRWESRLGGGGSAAPVVFATCREKRLDARIQQLKPLLCEGAGMTGSCAAAERF